MNSPSVPSALTNAANAITHAFPLPPIEAYFPDPQVGGDHALRDNPFANLSFDLDLPALDADSDADIPAAPSSRSVPAADVLLDALPSVMRIQSLSRLLEHDRIVNRAVLYHRKGSLCVDWITQQVDTRLHRHGLVSIRPAASVRCRDGATRIQRLLPVTKPMTVDHGVRLTTWEKARLLCISVVVRYANPARS